VNALKSGSSSSRVSIACTYVLAIVTRCDGIVLILGFIQILVKDNQGDEETTRIDSIDVFGSGKSRRSDSASRIPADVDLPLNSGSRDLEGPSQTCSIDDQMYDVVLRSASEAEMIFTDVDDDEHSIRRRCMRAAMFSRRVSSSYLLDMFRRGVLPRYQVGCRDGRHALG
jgi:hypothetical protein